MAGEMITLKSRFADGFAFSAYRVKPTDARRGGLVLVQEIFGVNDDVKALADGFAADGYEVIAPSMFDRGDYGFTAEHDEAGVAKGYQLMTGTPWDQALGDVQACIDALAGPVFITGFCYGGAMAWMAAANCTGLSGASAYYGGAIPRQLEHAPKVPIILHFGKDDPHIPLESVDAISAAYPDLPVWVYEGAGHGFAGSHRHHADSARLAKLRTLQLFHKASGSKGEMGG